MKYLTSKKTLTLCFAICMIIALCAGIFIANSTNATAFAEEASSDFRFSLNSAQNTYTVSALNRQLTEADIPETYNGLPVTELANNAFTNCTNLVKVTIPQTVTKIGSNAFYNCKNLESIVGMAKVETIGNTAFAMCPKLNNLVIPHTVTTLGNYILRNNSGTVYSRLSEEDLSEKNSLWNSNTALDAEIIYDSKAPIFDVLKTDENGEPLEYSLREWQLFYTEVNYTLFSSYKGVPITEIQGAAFSGSKCGTLKIMHDEDEDSPHSINLLSGALSNLEANEIDIEVDVTFDDELFGNEENVSTYVFSNSSITRITLPDNLPLIPDEAFSFCENLRLIISTNPYIEANHLPQTITSIGARAFEFCTSLPKLYIPNSVNTVGEDAFFYWGIENEQTISIDSYVPLWSDWYDEDATNLKIEYKKSFIVFDDNYDYSVPKYVEISYNQAFPQLVAPTREHYTFDGYYYTRDNQSNPVYWANMDCNAIWNDDTPLYLYAHWIPDSVTVTLNNQDCDWGESSFTAKHEQPLPDLFFPQKEGYKFKGYCTQPNGQGTQYYDEYMRKLVDKYTIPGPETLYAHWESEQYTIVLDQNGGTDGTPYITIEYGSVLPDNLIKPERPQYRFCGYYLGEGVDKVLYYDENMHSDYVWTFAETIVLEAQWEDAGATIKFEFENGDPFVTCEVPYDRNIESPSKPIMKWGYTFAGFYDAREGGECYINSSYLSERICNFEDDITLYAHWTPITYVINYEGVEGLNNSRNPMHYTIEDFNNFEDDDISMVFKAPIGLAYWETYEWQPAKIDKTTFGETTVKLVRYAKPLSEMKAEENGLIKYDIYTESQLLEMGNYDIQFGTNVIFYLRADIKMSYWAYTAYITREFVGTFDGQGHTISGVDIRNAPYSYGDAGFFVSIGSGSTVRNLRIIGKMNYSTIELSYAGLLCGTNRGTVKNCIVMGESFGGESTYDIYHNANVIVGEIVGRNEDAGVVIDCICLVRIEPED